MQGKTVAFEAPADFRVRATYMIVEFFASQSEEFEVSGGFVKDVRHVVVRIDKQLYPFSLPEARDVARMLEQTMGQLPQLPSVYSDVADLIMGIRHAADEIEKIEPEEVEA